MSKRAGFYRRLTLGIPLMLTPLHGTAAADGVAPGPFVWGETTHVADAGWGRMIDLGRGRWLCVDNLYPKPDSVLQIEVSADDARTWTPVSTVAEPKRDLDNGEVIRLPDGAFLLTCRSVIDHRVPGAALSYHLPVYRSADGGRTWAFVSQIDTSEVARYQQGRPSVGLWEPHFFLLPHSKIACAYADEKHAADSPAYSQTVAERVSSDGGKTWGREITLAAQPGGGGQRPGMPVVTRMTDGRYIAVYEVVGVGDADAYGKTSRDGVTWPDGIGSPIPGQHAGPWVASLRDGRLVVSSCENQVSLSNDYGKTWQITSPPAWAIGHVFSWPAIYQTGPNGIAVMSSFHGVNIRRGKIIPRPATARPAIP